MLVTFACLHLAILLLASRHCLCDAILTKRSDGEGSNREIRRSGLPPRDRQREHFESYAPLITATEDRERMMMSRVRRHFEISRRRAFDSLLQARGIRIDRNVAEAVRRRDEDYRARRRRQLRHTGVPLDIIPGYFEPFLVNGQFPEGISVHLGDWDVVPASFSERLELERANAPDRYHCCKFEYAKELSVNDLPLDAWQRLLANRNFKALRIREDFHNRAAWIMRQVRRILLENHHDASNTTVLEEEYGYARLMLDLFYDEGSLSQQDYESRIENGEAHAMEARAMFQQVYRDPWPRQSDVSSDEEDLSP